MVPGTGIEPARYQVPADFVGNLHVNVHPMDVELSGCASSLFRGDSELPETDIPSKAKCQFLGASVRVLDGCG